MKEVRLKEDIITLKTAKLAKEKGFKLSNAQHSYSEENNYNLSLNVYTKEDLLNYKIYPAPTQALLQKWLRNEKKLSVLPFLKFNSVDKIWSYKIESLKTDFYTEKNTDDIIENTYEEILEEGLQEALMSL